MLKKSFSEFAMSRSSVTVFPLKVISFTGMFPVGDTSCRTLIDVCVCVCVCVSVCPPTYR